MMIYYFIPNQNKMCPIAANACVWVQVSVYNVKVQAKSKVFTIRA